MSTFKDVKDLYWNVDVITKMVGASGEFMSEFGKKSLAIGEAMCEELGVLNLESLLDLPDNTELGPEVQARFEELKRWLPSQSQYFKSYAEK